ncbi:MAG: N-carbamoylputrescine amidase, partial [Pseudohongiellaceae bacterium]
MRPVTVAATQMSCGWDVDANIAKAEALVREAAAKGAQIILIQELFERCYFCQKQIEGYMAFATPVDENPAVKHFQTVAAELKVVLPISFYERANNAFYNTVAIIDADGSNLGIYRKTHIPDGPGYSEKFYFTPGDTGFKVWDTAYARIGVGICWDQWFPETARAMALMGAELLFYPTAIGSEPQDNTIDSRDHWQLTQQGHAAANLTPYIASNRTGVEAEDEQTISFYGSSFIANELGQKV